jgi:hypothetical protein
MSEEHEIAYTALAPGTRVLSSQGDVIGTVERVLDIPDLDLFDGIVIETPDGDRFVDRDQIARITTQAVYCTVSTDEAASLSVPDSAPTYRAHAGRGSRSFTRWLGNLFGRRAKWRREHDDQ